MHLQVGRPSDVWSLGCILYLLVYGRTPFEHIKNKLKKWQAIIDPSVAVPFPELQNKAAIDIMQVHVKQLVCDRRQDGYLLVKSTLYRHLSPYT